jgi:hypothetical protein
LFCNIFFHSELTPGPLLCQQQFLGLPFSQALCVGQALQTLPHPFLLHLS